MQAAVPEGLGERSCLPMILASLCTMLFMGWGVLGVAGPSTHAVFPSGIYGMVRMCTRT